MASPFNAAMKFVPPSLDMSALPSTPPTTNEEDLQKAVAQMTQAQPPVESAPQVQAIPAEPSQSELEPGTPETQAEPERLNDLLSRYREAKQKEEQGKDTSDYMRYANMISTGIAGKGAEKAPEEFFKTFEHPEASTNVLEEIKARPAIEDVYTQEELLDKDSSISKLARDVIKQKFPKINVEGMSAGQLQKLGFKLSTVLANQAQGKWDLKAVYNPASGKHEMKFVNSLSGEVKDSPYQRSLAPQFRIDPSTGEVSQFNVYNGAAVPVTGPASKNAGVGATPGTEGQPSLKTRKDFTAADRKVIDDTRNDFGKDKEVEAGRSALSGAQNARQMLQFGKDYNADIQRAVQNMLARATGERGVMTEQDVAPFKGKQDLWNKMLQMGVGTFKGKFTDENRQYLTNFANALENAARSRIKNNAASYIQRVSDDLGVDQSNAERLLNIDKIVQTNVMHTIRNKKTGQVKRFKESDAKIILQNPDYEEVK